MMVACPACASDSHELYGRYTDEEYFTSEDRFEYRRCRACGSLFIDPMPVDRLSEIYPGNYYSFATGPSNPVVRLKERMDARYFKAVLNSIPGAELAVLDVGGGTGWLLNLLRSLDPRVRRTQVVDLDPAAGEQARANGHEYACQRIEEFSSPHRFDLVLMLNLIEHVAEPRAVLRNVASLLSPAGRVIVKTPNVDAADARLFRSSYWAGLHVPRHWTLFTRASFEQMLRGTGLAVKCFGYTQGAPFWAASVLAALRRRGWIEASRERPVVYHPLFSALGAAFAAFDLLRAPVARTSQMTFVLGRDG